MNVVFQLLLQALVNYVTKNPEQIEKLIEIGVQQLVANFQPKPL